MNTAGNGKGVKHHPSSGKRNGGAVTERAATSGFGAVGSGLTNDP